MDYVVELSDLGRTVNTADMKRLFHETLVQEMVTSDSFISSNNSDYRQLRLGKYTIDPASTDFVGKFDLISLGIAKKLSSWFILLV